MKTCGQCIYWQKVKGIKDYGQCTVELPPWVEDNIEAGYEIIYKHSKMATHCYNFREEQEEGVEDLRFTIKQLEDKLYTAKVQESLTRPIVDEYGKAS